MAEIVLTNHSATCWHKDCTNAGTVWSHFQWWCAAHAPSSSWGQIWRYFCGCCWNEITDRQEIARRLIEDGAV